MSLAIRVLGPINSTLRTKLFVPVTCKHVVSIKRALSDSTTPPEQPKTEGELLIMKLLKGRFPNAKEVEASDISGGCGSMYAVYVETGEFKGLRKIKQHKMVQDALKEEIKGMHGIRVQTAVPGEKI